MNILKEIEKFCLRFAHWLYFNLIRKSKNQTPQYEEYVRFFNQEANDYVYNLLMSGKPCMISKFGTIELSALIQQKSLLCKKFSLADYIDYVKGDRCTLWWPIGIDALCQNAGFFPNNFNLLEKFYDINLESVKQIDVLGSYKYGEKYFKEELNRAVRVNLEGYYAPFFFKNPWTKALAGKRVLVIHPFSNDIEQQYNRKNEIWEDRDLLPDFTLITYKSVQSMLGIKTPYDTWFDALESMKTDIDKIDFDIAIVGCGAYGMPLSAHIKKRGKQAIHLAGWTQILFGIIGRRWEEDERVAKFFNSSWIHPSPSEIPMASNKIEGGCYW